MLVGVLVETLQKIEIHVKECRKQASVTGEGEQRREAFSLARWETEFLRPTEIHRWRGLRLKEGLEASMNLPRDWVVCF
ncbi:hypothetical protein K1719_027980 [Acacia pycnantha]|nr:hypothetical protein K1719_027980 [Acacia pycnantha]